MQDFHVSMHGEQIADACRDERVRSTIRALIPVAERSGLNAIVAVGTLAYLAGVLEVETPWIDNPLANSTNLEELSRALVGEGQDDYERLFRDSDGPACRTALEWCNRLVHFPIPGTVQGWAAEDSSWERHAGEGLGFTAARLLVEAELAGAALPIRFPLPMNGVTGWIDGVLNLMMTRHSKAEVAHHLPLPDGSVIDHAIWFGGPLVRVYEEAKTADLAPAKAEAVRKAEALRAIVPYIDVSAHTLFVGDAPRYDVYWSDFVNEALPFLLETIYQHGDWFHEDDCWCSDNGPCQDDGCNCDCRCHADDRPVWDAVRALAAQK